MNDLIKITKSNIGAEVINSVNAREIHSYLEVKTAFTTWFNRTVEKYDFTLNEDFISFLKESNGGRPQQEHIVSLDMAKELCLVEPNEKGKETRKYFIEVEKRQNRVLTTSEQIILLAQGHQEVEQRLTQIEHKIENDITLTSIQKHHLKKAVNKKVYELIDNHKLSEDFIKKGHMRVWKKIKDTFIVSSYMEIPKSKFDEAYGVINLMTIDDLMQDKYYD